MGKQAKKVVKKTFIEWIRYMQDRKTWGGCNVYPKQTWTLYYGS